MGSKGIRERVEGRVREFLVAHDLDHPSQPLVVGVSGGPDSLCLLYALDRLREEFGLSLHIAHLNHCLRGRGSEEDAAFVSRLAQEMGIPSTIGREDVRLWRSPHSHSLEERAREARYAFLGRVAQETRAQGILVAHTSDDQTETVLLHLLRGSGVPGLRGMRSVHSFSTPMGGCIMLFRPLLDLPRSDTEAYCRALSLTPRLDPSNRSTDYLRNRIRLELIPFLRDYNPNVEAALQRLAVAASLDMEFIEGEVGRAWASVVKEAPGGLRVDSERLCALPPSLRLHLLRRALETLLGDLVDIEQGHIAALEKLMAKPTGKTLCLPRGVTATMEYGQCLLALQRAEEDTSTPIRGEHRLAVPGETRVDGWVVRASVVAREECRLEAGGLKAALDLDKVGQDLTVRGRRRGDRFQPLGMEHEKKLQDFLVDSKVPRRLRDGIPLVCAQGQIVWVVGLRIDDRAKVTESTSQVLLLEFEKEESPDEGRC